MNNLIPNATSPKNIGDLAILNGLLSIIEKNNKLIIHSSENKLYKNITSNNVHPNLYYWVVFNKKDIHTRLKRVINLFINYFSLRFTGVAIPVNKEFQKLINDYKNADLILFVGGGYLRTQKGITQSLNLIMTLMMFQFAKLMQAKKIVAPISFGPFAYKWQEEYAASVLQDLDLVSVREEYSHELLKKHKIKNLIRSADTSMFINLKKQKKTNQFVLGFTIRKWLNEKEQIKFENIFINSIVSFSNKVNLIVQPIIQVDAPEYGDLDAQLTKEISDKLKKEGLRVKEIIKIQDLKKSVTIYGKINLLLGMRMHSNILAALQGTPFVAIGYEHKTQGISKDLGMEEYCIDIIEISEDKLVKKLVKAYQNRLYLERTIDTSVKRIRKEESFRWTKIFQTI